MVDQQLLRPHHVADRDHRKGEGPGLAGRRVDRPSGRWCPCSRRARWRRSGNSARCRARLPGPTSVVHQPGLPVIGCGSATILVAGQRVADQDRVAALGVERAVGLIGDRERAEIDAAVEPQRLLDCRSVWPGQSSRGRRRRGAVKIDKRRPEVKFRGCRVRTRRRSARPPIPDGRRLAMDRGPGMSTFSLILTVWNPTTIARSGSDRNHVRILRPISKTCADASTGSTTGSRTC